MTPTKLLVGQILIVFVIGIAGVSSATQWAAFQLGYQGQLRAPWAVLSGIPVYYPRRLFEWWYAVDEESEGIEDEGGMQQRCHPGLPEEGVAKTAAPEPDDPLGLAEDDTDPVADRRAIASKASAGDRSG